MNDTTHSPTEAVDVGRLDRVGRGTESAELGRAQYHQLLDLLEGLEGHQWEVTTECAPWTVHQMVAHVLGAARSTASLLEMARQQLHGLRHRHAFGGNPLDATNDLQVREHQARSPRELVDALRDVADRAARRRAATPRLVGRVSFPIDPGGSTATGMPPRVTLANLQYCIYTRDTFLHRIDVARATGTDPAVGTDADRRLVEDVVVEWAGRHGQPMDLTLTGPAGGRFVQGVGGPAVQLDTVEFCRVLSGRAPGDGLLATRVLF